MDASETVIDQLAKRAEIILEPPAHEVNRSSISELLAEIDTTMAASTDSRKVLGPLIAKLRAVESSTSAPPVTWISVLNGHLAIGHRPKIKTIRNMRRFGVKIVVTLLTESEGAAEIGKEVRSNGLDWVWLPLESAEPPIETRKQEILNVFHDVRSALNAGSRVFVHCSAGIHRTGMIAYAILRHAGYSGQDTSSLLAELRLETAAGVGENRKHWGDQFGEHRSQDYIGVPER